MSNSKYTEYSNSRILIMTAVQAEREAVERGLQHSDRFDVRIAGVGPAAAAASTAYQLAEKNYDLVISAGIGGGFVPTANIGDVVVANQLIYADLGAESPDGFISVDELGFGSSRLETENSLVERVVAAFQRTGLTVVNGNVLTVSTATGTADTAVLHKERFPEAAAEAMEGYGVAIAAVMKQLPVLEIRTISNAVGPRDREAWRIREALEALEAASRALLEVI